MVTLWCLQFSLKSPELCYWHHRLPIQGNAVKFISVLSTPNKSSKQGTIWQIRPWKCGFSMWGVKLLKSWMITACTFSPGISYSYFTCHFLVHPITSLSLSLSLHHPQPSFLFFPLLPPSSAIIFGLFFLILCFCFGWGSSCDSALKWASRQIRHFYNAFLVGGRGAGRSRDWREGMMYVAAVSLLSSSPLSLITTISFFQSCLVCTVPQKSHCFFMLQTRGEERGKKETLVLFFLLPHSASQSLPPLLSFPFYHPAHSSCFLFPL